MSFGSRYSSAVGLRSRSRSRLTWPRTAKIFPLETAAVKDFDYQKLMQALKQIDYQDWCVFEFEAIPNENNAKAGFDYIKGLLKQL